MAFFLQDFPLVATKKLEKSRYVYITRCKTKSWTCFPSFLASKVSLPTVMDRTERRKDQDETPQAGKRTWGREVEAEFTECMDPSLWSSSVNDKNVKAKNQTETVSDAADCNTGFIVCRSVSFFSLSTPNRGVE